MRDFGVPVNPSCPVIVAVACEEDYILSVAFESWEEGLLDMKPYLDFGLQEDQRS